MMQYWQALSFREPLWLLLALQPLLLLALSLLRRQMYRSQYSEAQLLPWTQAQTQGNGPMPYIRHALVLLAWCLFAMAMAGPRLPQTTADQQGTAQRQVMVLLDISPSMSARDVQPNRLQRAQLELLDLINRMQGTRMGIIVYGARPHLLSPMTTDKGVLRHYLNALQTRQLPTLGSQLHQAIDFAQQQFKSDSDTPRAILIVSDGEDHSDNINQRALENRVAQLRQANILVYALGIGTRYGAPLLGDDQAWLQHDGQTVNSRLKAEHLQRLCQIGGGRYSGLHSSNLDWQQLYDEGIGQLKPVNQTSEIERIIWNEQYHGFLIAGLLCLLLSLWQPGRNKPPTQLIMLFVVGVLGAGTHDVHAVQSDYATAYRQLQDKEYSQAQKGFRQLAGYAARMGEGSARYHLQEYKAAAQQFTQAILDAGSDQQRGQALFNLANCHYQLNNYQQAARLYKDVLRYLPDHAGARSNREYAMALQDEEIKSERTAHRAGHGPQTGRAPEGMSTEGVRGMTLGDDEKDQPSALPQVVTPESRATQQSLQQTRAASSKVEDQSDREWQYRITSLEQLQRETPHIESYATKFWQRLFEHEEGFMAPVEQAHSLPEVKPW